jgi:hypothetical protein
MNPQITRLGFNSRIRSHIDWASKRFRGRNSFEPLTASMSKTPSHFSKNGHSSDVNPEFITSTAICAADRPDAVSATGSLRAFNIP